MEENYTFEIQVLYDDICAKDGYIKDFGFSVVVYNTLTNSHVLFDAGSNGKILLHNLKAANLHPSKIDAIVISHDHFDHAGGLEAFIRFNQEFKLFVPKVAKNRYKEIFPEWDVCGVAEKKEIDSNIFTSGVFGESIKEQALFLKTRSENLVLLVGCTHPGLESMILEARKSNNIEAIIGGFHGFRKLSHLKEIDFIGACHCTHHRQLIREKFPKTFKEVCVGSKFMF